VKNPVFITGKSLTCSLGEDLDMMMACLQQKQAPMDLIPLSLADPATSRPYYRIHPHDQTVRNNVETYFYKILFDTVARAIADAGLLQREVEDLAIFFGSTSIDIPIYESHYEKSDDDALNHFSQASYGYGAIVSETSKHFGIKGPCYTFTTACTSSANALLYAAAMIEKGSLERALVIGYDLFNNTGFYGFESLRLTATSACKPFDKNRDGIIMGEACGAVILERQCKRVQDFRYLGGANLCDTFNVTTHNVEGDVIAEVIRQAMLNAGVTPGDIAAVKAHATGSEMNDRMEANGMRQVFMTEMPPVTGIKPFVGHTVGAAGVVELILFTEAVKKGFLPATLGFTVMDEELMITPVTENMPMAAGIFILNYFGFGGNCTSMIVCNRS
jgi:3-oxoacyl-[acyl-carrier-protein] synthase I